MKKPLTSLNLSTQQHNQQASIEHERTHAHREALEGQEDNQVQKTEQKLSAHSGQNQGRRKTMPQVTTTGRLARQAMTNRDPNKMWLKKRKKFRTCREKLTTSVYKIFVH